MRLFTLCEAMGWNHLPVRGALYDQHPKLLEDWTYIFQAKNEHDETERRRDEERRKAERQRGR